MNEFEQSIKELLIVGLSEFSTEGKFRKPGADLSDITLKYEKKFKDLFKKQKHKIQKEIKKMRIEEMYGDENLEGYSEGYNKAIDGVIESLNTNDDE